eukprot:CAMPEP_0113690198 /NCGR_PEP_ID=MMETSP0038_2-20120614/17634_1 /TAXON_ID=2898 /ORGANISM="Cryptomonas paramecium" /LENGTH=252 /DNA_ID=CAMNT_0000611449 /DNA_START=40 /DNA_END=795 /DNA_ORIENTATION=- /assembly_acc=CAM_ASM_000170
MAGTIPNKFHPNRIVRSYMIARKPVASSQIIAVKRFIQCRSFATSNTTNRPPESENEVVVYNSGSEQALNFMGVGSIVQAGICVVMAGLVTFHPAAASSALLPGWTFQGRAMLGAGVVAFGCAMGLGFKGFLSKNIIRVATIPSDPDHLNVYLFSFPAGTTRYRVPRREFYAITAAFSQFNLDSERKGPAPVLPVYVGGPLIGTYLMDVSSGIVDAAAVRSILSDAISESSGAATVAAAAAAAVPEEGKQEE